MLVFLGKAGCVSNLGPSVARSTASRKGTKMTACGLPIDTVVTCVPSRMGGGEGGGGNFGVSNSVVVTCKEEGERGGGGDFGVWCLVGVVVFKKEKNAGRPNQIKSNQIKINSNQSIQTRWLARTHAPAMSVGQSASQSVSQ